MMTADFSFLEVPLDGEALEKEETEEQNKIPLVNLAPNEIDPRYTRHSFSSMSLFNGCPRKFQLSRLRVKGKPDYGTSVTYAFGHAVGDAIPRVLEGMPLSQVFFKMFLEWDVDLLAENPKQKKSFIAAMQAVRMFAGLREEEDFQHYIPHKLTDGRLAAEMSFKIEMQPSSFREIPHTFRGYIDLVLENLLTGELTVLENKTNSGAWVNHYSYKNSAQAIGYGTILEAIHPETTAYEVLYCIFMTRLERFEVFPFPKNYHQKAMWLRDIMYNVDRIEHLVKMEGNYGIWPMNGDRCTDYGGVCEFMDVCHMDTSKLMNKLTEEDLIDRNPQGKTASYDYTFTLEELLGD